MLDGLKEFINLRFHVMLFLVGILLIYLAMFSSIPNPANSWSFTPRATTSLELISMGVGLIVGAIFVYLYSPDATGPPRFLFSGSIKRNHSQLSDTQKEILRTLYEYHEKEATLEAFFTHLRSKKGEGFVQGEDELYFRLKDLAAKRLLYLKSVGRNASVLQPLWKVARVLKYPSPN